MGEGRSDNWLGIGPEPVLVNSWLTTWMGKRANPGRGNKRTLTQKCLPFIK